jgi:hypothetical protein
MYTSYIVRRTQIYLEDDQDDLLTRRAQGSAVTKSMLIRQAIDAFLDESMHVQSGLVRFRSALREVEQAPLALPEGASYVEDVRALDEGRQRQLDRQLERRRE